MNKRPVGKITLEDFFRKRCIPLLRKASIWWPERLQALQRQKVGRSHYMCEFCKRVFPKVLVHVDHKEPVVAPTGLDVTEYIQRLLCPMEGFQILCATCHQEKTNKERLERKPRAKRS